MEWTAEQWEYARGVALAHLRRRGVPADEAGELAEDAALRSMERMRRRWRAECGNGAWRAFLFTVARAEAGRGLHQLSRRLKAEAGFCRERARAGGLATLAGRGLSPRALELAAMRLDGAGWKECARRLGVPPAAREALKDELAAALGAAPPIGSSRRGAGLKRGGRDGPF